MNISNQIVLTSGIAANVALSTGTLSQLEGRVKYVSEKAIKVVNKRLERQKIREALSKIDQSLADTFSTTWQYMAYPAFDSGRGPLAQMRQTFDHFLSIIAPDAEVEAQPDFEPDQELKKKNGKGMTRKHRVEYFSKYRVTDESYSKAIINTWQIFDDMYTELNMMHGREKIGRGQGQERSYAR